MRVKGQVCDESELRRRLAEFAAKCRARAQDPTLLIRSDEGRTWRSVQQVMKICKDPEVDIYLLGYATRREEGD